MSLENTTDLAPSDDDEPTPTNYLTLPLQSGLTYLQQYQQPVGHPFPYVTSNIAGHPSLPPMGAFLMPAPSFYSPLGPFYPGPALPYPFMLPFMAAPSVPAAVSSGDSSGDVFPSEDYRAASHRTARTQEDGTAAEKEAIAAEKEAVEYSDTERMPVAAVAGRSPPASPWITGPDATVLQALSTSNDVVSPVREPAAYFPSTSTASVQSTPNGTPSLSNQSKRSLEDFLRTDGRETEKNTNSAIPSNPQLAHFCELVSRSKMATLVQIRNLTTDGDVPLTWLEITRKSCHIDANLGPISVARILVSSNGLCKLQLLYPYFKTISTRLIPADDEGVELLLSDLGPQYVLCPGLPNYEQKYDIIGYHVPHVRVMNACQMKRYDHDNCLLWHVPANLFSPSGHHLHNMCQHCKYLENKLAKMCGNQYGGNKDKGNKKGSGHSTKTPPYDAQQRGQRQRKPSLATGARGLEPGSKCPTLLVRS